jgi:tripartite-type tricarboxylate transporter receptor subunit TctC
MFKDPTVVELAPDARGKNIMRLAASASKIGRSFLAPPGTAPERVTILRQALARMLQDKEFIAESGRRGLEVEPLPPDGILQMVADGLEYAG